MEHRIEKNAGKGLSAAFFTLGCRVNQYETQLLREQFGAAGFELRGEEDRADIYVVNTCTVTNMSDRKSRQLIRRIRKTDPKALIVVTGCYVQMKPDEACELPGVIVAAGTNEKNHIIDYVNSYLKKKDRDEAVERHIFSYDQIRLYDQHPGIRSMDDRSRAFIKVQEGCNRFCSYCVIPYARGRARSRDAADILREARTLIDSGYRELVLTGINTALYGADLPENHGRSGIDSLISKVAELDGCFRIRIGSLEPNVIDEETAISVISQRKLCHHMHFSIQSGCDTVLERMNRHYDTASYKKLVQILRSEDPLYGISTDIIVGFPGETEEEFQQTLDTVREIGFSRIHGFRYSSRDGTAAAQMPDQIPGNIKNERMERLLKAAEESETAFMKKNEGTVRTVLFEGSGDLPGTAAGYTDNYIRVRCRCGSPEDMEGVLARVRLDSTDLVSGDTMNGTVTEIISVADTDGDVLNFDYSQRR